MNLINVLFWCITVPGVYLGGMCITYKILRKTLFKDARSEFEIDDCRLCAGFWIFTAPIILVFVAPIHGIAKLFDMIDGGGAK